MNLASICNIFSHGEARRARAILRQTCNKQQQARLLAEELKVEADRDLRRCKEIENRRFKESYDQRWVVRTGVFKNTNPHARVGTTKQIREMDCPRAEIAEPSLIILALA